MWGKVVLVLIAIFIAGIVMEMGEVQASNAIIAYSDGTGTCGGTPLNCPQIRLWDSSGSGSWGSAVELSTAGSPIRTIVVKYSPVTGKIVIVTQSTDSALDGYVCMDNCDQAGSWNVANNIAQTAHTTSTNGGRIARRFDIEFERSTGDAVLVYGVESTNTTRDLAYKVLPAETNSFSGLTESYIDDSGHSTDLNYTWVAMAQDPVSTSQELIVTGFDYTDNDVVAWVWDGSAWGNQQEIAAAATANSDMEALAVAYEADGGNGTVLAGDSTAGNVAAFQWTGSAWVNIADFDIDSGDSLDLRFIALKPDPATDDLQAVFVDSGADLGTSYWNGGSWSVTSNIDTGADASISRGADFEWNPSGSTGRLVWDTDTTGSTLSNRTCAPQCTQSTTTISTYQGTGVWLTLFRNPTDGDSVNFLGVRINSTNKTGSFRFEGTSYTNYGDTQISTNGTFGDAEFFSIAYQLANTLTNFTVELFGNNLTKSVPTSGQNRSNANVEFNGTDADAKNINGSIIGNSSANQSLTVSMLLINNTGNVPIKIILMLNASAPSGTLVFADLDNNTAGAAEINATQENILNQSIPVGVKEEIWVWTNYTSFASSGSVVDINISSRAA